MKKRTVTQRDIREYREIKEALTTAGFPPTPGFSHSYPEYVPAQDDEFINPNLQICWLAGPPMSEDLWLVMSPERQYFFEDCDDQVLGPVFNTWQGAVTFLVLTGGQVYECQRQAPSWVRGEGT